MHTVYDWSAKRAGPAMTVYGKDGPDGEIIKAVGVNVIGLQPLDGGDTGVVGVGKDGQRYLLAVPRSNDHTRAVCDRIADILNVGTGNRARDDALAVAKLEDIRRVLDGIRDGGEVGAIYYDAEERATISRLCDWGVRRTDTPDSEVGDRHKALLRRIAKKADPKAMAGTIG